MSFDIVRGIVTKPQQTKIVVDKIREYINDSNDNGTLYLGYPLTASTDKKITIDALLLSETHGMISFMYENIDSSVEQLKDEQDALYYHMDFYLKKYGSLRQGRSLVVDPVIITVLADKTGQDIVSEGYYFEKSSNLVSRIKTLPAFNKSYYRVLCEALQKVTNIRPQKKRVNVSSTNSKGWIIKEIEKEIANLDEWQKKAALEVPNGPQRIRGLAGTGKTIVLALKAAYLHTQNPEWNIMITYYTRSLKQQYEELINKFVNDFSGEKPDWSKLKILHAWGSKSEEGVYYNFTQRYNAPSHSLSSAISKFGRDNLFKGMCEELLSFSHKESLPELYDAILIDEAQDLPSQFFQLIYKNVKAPKRIIWAYDELQNLSDVEMPSLLEMFGSDENGDSLINIDNITDEPQRDIILPICYRNPPWTLTMAHALGFGLYNKASKLPVQTFDKPKMWLDIGYSVVSGMLDYGKIVTIERENNAIPEYFERFLDKNDSISAIGFESKEKQYFWIAQEIDKNLTVDELEPDDILVVFPDSYTSKSEYEVFARYLRSFGIDSFLAGVNSSQDMFRVSGSVTCSGIFRAKGNESPMVYIVNSEYCAVGAELIKLRNILFTAITRSRAWVRICGVGETYKLLSNEFENCKKQDFRLKFKVPTKPEMVKIRKINRERTEEEKIKVAKAKSSIEELIVMLNKGDIDKTSTPELETLINILKKKNRNE